MRPPYHITNKIVEYIASISEKIGEVNSAHLYRPLTELRKKNRIKTIQSSLDIEGNTLSIAQITAILENKKVIAPKKVLTDWPKAKQYHVINITNFIKKWYYDKIPNYGLMGYSINTETTNSAVFCSSIYPVKALQPKLIVIFKKNKA
jgi:hypothetical protein